MEVRVVGLDPALSNLGIAIACVNIHTLDIRIEELRLIQTEGDKKSAKTVRKNSDDLRRSRLLFEGMVDACEGAAFAIAEVPIGSQSARAMASYGVCMGLLASCPLPIVQVQPSEAKLAATGSKTAPKDKMIEWAMGKYPDANWLMVERGGRMVPVDKNEHLADAIASIEAGIRTDQFKQATALLKAMRA